MTDIATIAALADELCDPHQHTERVPYWDHSRHRRYREHRTVQPGLLAQLHELWETASRIQLTDDDGAGRPIPTSRPPASIDAASVHVQVTTAAARWCWSLQLQLRDTVESNIRALVGAAGTLDDETRTALADEMATWCAMASALTGWTAPPYRPHVPCPGCGRAGKLRINLRRHVGACLACGLGWDGDGLHQLADYVRAATEVVA